MQMENRPTEEELMAQEEKCRKSMKTVTKAIFMRGFVLVLLFWILLKTTAQPWVMGMLLFVVLITVSGTLPLAAELKKRRRELKAILEQYE